LARKDRASEAIPSAIQANDQAVTHQLVVAHALHIHYILDADLGGGGRRKETHRQGEGGKDFCERLRYTGQVLSPAATLIMGGGLFGYRARPVPGFHGVFAESQRQNLPGPG
jgi:hypothetical protein